MRRKNKILIKLNKRSMKYHNMHKIKYIIQDKNFLKICLNNKLKLHPLKEELQILMFRLLKSQKEQKIRMKMEILYKIKRITNKMNIKQNNQIVNNINFSSIKY